MKKIAVALFVACFVLIGLIYGIPLAFEKTSCVAVWEEVYEEGRDKEVTEIRVKHFASEEKAIEYLNKNEVKKHPWEEINGKWTSVWSGERFRTIKKSTFIGVYPLIKKLPLQKAEEPMPITKEVWKKEAGK